MPKFQEHIENRSQSWCFTSLWDVELPQKVHRVIKTDIRLNAYHDQSHLRAYLFDGDQWFLIWDHLPDMGMWKLISYAQKNLDKKQLALVELEESHLVQTVKRILNVHFGS